MNAPVIGHALHGHGHCRVLALHGWFGDHHAYDPIVPLLATEGYSLALMDQRGYGLSRDRDGPCDIATIAADALALADHLGWERFSVIGHSMGGKAALRLAASAPDRVQAVAAITPVWAGAAPFDAEALALFRAAATETGAREAIIRHSTSDRLADEWYAALVRESTIAARVEPFAAYFESWALDDFADAVQGLAVPVQVIVGAHDQAITPELVKATWCAALADTRLAVLAGAGHYPMQENPVALVRVLVEFFDRIAA